MMVLFRGGEFVAHSGARLPFKIDCDALTDDDLETLARYFAVTNPFGRAYGVPRGGLRFAEALNRHSQSGGEASWGNLIVDDVLTTGASMEAYREDNWPGWHGTKGVVIFARGPCPSWVTPIFTMMCPKGERG